MPHSQQALLVPVLLLLLMLLGGLIDGKATERGSICARSS
jgi:hypothetical protein